MMNKKKTHVSFNRICMYTGGRGRTGTSVKTLDFESSASANSATPANSYYMEKTTKLG